MKRFFLLLIFSFFAYISWPLLNDHLAHSDYALVINNIKAEIDGLKGNAEYSAAIDSFYEEIHQLLVGLDQTIEKQPKEIKAAPKQIKKPNLTTPTQQQFSVNNIELGDLKEKVESTVGTEKRSSYNEYGIKWYAYHENYQHFFMVAYDQNNKVVGLYTNQDLIASTKGIKRGSAKEFVRQQLGNPLTKIEKGNIYYQFKGDQDNDLFLIDGSYVTIFYDKHENNTVTSIQMISEKLEKNKQDFYAEETPQLIKGFEYQLFDLTNAARVNHGLQILTWNDHVKETAKKHSIDMAEHHYFDHNNLQGQSPFDRMHQDHVVFSVAGENLAYGQFSSVFAHEGLMNSQGHRDNILRSEFEFLGVGVAFNTESQPYYTENFYTN
ncbi:CAP domain-containing protein [Bacillus sp. 1NLA3E]|uniref:CAP domain-containing protein n=1 Tax=Bacillus sp. 1NLA3E TaxID=666686 RepID=UPI000247F45A|nr:CAP domain-containing protein [Bacillus sp. 1NLA3E]AGK53798.1 SCP-like extracellular [Bacillus sp. 1NLA3E]